MFEDDDYSHRARLAGFRVVCLEDVFVHHVGQASFSKLDRETYDGLWRRNQAYFETKWGVPWEKHSTR
jgi:GT2 family glycosyltransferase